MIFLLYIWNCFILFPNMLINNDFFLKKTLFIFLFIYSTSFPLPFIFSLIFEIGSNIIMKRSLDSNSDDVHTLSFRILDFPFFMATILNAHAFQEDTISMEIYEKNMVVFSTFHFMYLTRTTIPIQILKSASKHAPDEPLTQLSVNISNLLTLRYNTLLPSCTVIIEDDVRIRLHLEDNTGIHVISSSLSIIPSDHDDLKDKINTLYQLKDKYWFKCKINASMFFKMLQMISHYKDCSVTVEIKESTLKDKFISFTLNEKTGTSGYQRIFKEDNGSYPNPGDNNQEPDTESYLKMVEMQENALNMNTPSTNIFDSFSSSYSKGHTIVSGKFILYSRSGFASLISPPILNIYSCFTNCGEINTDDAPLIITLSNHKTKSEHFIVISPMVGE